jgi:hypothetical protein
MIKWAISGHDTFHLAMMDTKQSHSIIKFMQNDRNFSVTKQLTVFHLVTFNLAQAGVKLF